MKYTTKNNSNIHKGHRSRLRNELYANNFTNVSEHKILEYLLFHCNAQKDTNPLAHDLINHFGSLRNVLEANVKDLMKVQGVGEVSAYFLASIIPIMNYINLQKSKGKIKTETASEIVKVYADQIRYNSSEKFLMIALNNKYEAISSRILDVKGFENCVNVNFQECYRYLTSQQCSKLIIMHNHPSDIPQPSPNDIINTKNLVQYLQLLGITLVEHIIVTKDNFYSFRDNGFIDEFYKAFKKPQNS